MIIKELHKLLALGRLCLVGINTEYLPEDDDPRTERIVALLIHHYS